MAGGAGLGGVLGRAGRPRRRRAPPRPRRAAAASASAIRAGCAASSPAIRVASAGQPRNRRRGVARRLFGMAEGRGDTCASPASASASVAARPALLLDGSCSCATRWRSSAVRASASAVAQRRQRGGGVGGPRRRGGRRRCRLGNNAPRRRQRIGRRYLKKVGAGALDRQQLGLGGADRAGDVAVAAGLPGLALQAAKLGFQAGPQVLGPRQVGLRRAQLQLRLVPPRVQAGDARGLLQQRAPLLRPRRDQRADAALADHRRRPRAARRQVGEQRLHVARPRLAAR